MGGQVMFLHHQGNSPDTGGNVILMERLTVSHRPALVSATHNNHQSKLVLPDSVSPSDLTGLTFILRPTLRKDPHPVRTRTYSHYKGRIWNATPISEQKSQHLNKCRVSFSSFVYHVLIFQPISVSNYCISPDYKA